MNARSAFLFFLPSLAALVPFHPVLAQAPTQISIPAGTAIPVALHGSLSTQRSKPGQVIKAQVMQDVPLPDGHKIRAGAYVHGKVLSVSRAASGNGARISFEFDEVDTPQGPMPVVITLRALASIVEINDAQLPMYGGDRGTPLTAYQTTQVGGEIVYRGGGHVMDGRTVVGEPVYDGVMSQVRSNPNGNCRGIIYDNSRLQALWLFSSDACGVYGYSRVKIAHAGRTSPEGEIVLASRRGNINIRGGSGMLLRVIHPTATAAGL